MTDQLKLISKQLVSSGTYHKYKTTCETPEGTLLVSNDLLLIPDVEPHNTTMFSALEDSSAEPSNLTSVILENFK